MNYTLKKDVVEVIPFTRENVKQIKTLCPDLTLCLPRHPEGRLIGTCERLGLKIQEGDYLLLNKDYRLQAVDALTFHLFYQPLGVNTDFTLEEQELMVMALRRFAMEKRTEGWQADANHQRYTASVCFEMANQLIDLTDKVKQMMKK